MEFGWSPEQLEIHTRMRALGAEADAAAPDARMAILAQGGALGLSLPEEYGGAGLDLVTTAFAYEGLGASLGDGGVLLAAGAHLFGVALTITRTGTPAQRHAWLPRLATGEAMATVAATEAGSGSDVASMESTAEPTPDGLRITGEKRYVTWADRADVYLTLARNGSAGRGLTALLVPRATPGVLVEAPLQTAGLRGARLAPVSFAGCEVPPDAILGRAGAGGPVFQVAMTFERALVLAFRLGALDRALGDAVTVARDRDASGAPLARHQAVAHRIARMKLRLETSRLLIYRAAWALDQGHRAQAEAALAKWHVAESAIESALDALRLHGGAGFLEESGLPAAVDDALGGSIHSGTSDVLATVVARWLGV